MNYFFKLITQVPQLLTSTLATRQASLQGMRIAVLLLSLSASACVASQKPNDGFNPPASGELSTAFNTAMARCNQSDTVSQMGKNGCIAGVNELAQQRISAGLSYASVSECIADVRQTAAKLPDLTKGHAAWCEQNFANLYDVAGCKSAASPFYQNITPISYCRSNPQSISTPQPLQQNAEPGYALPAAQQFETEEPKLPLPNSSTVTMPFAAPNGTEAFITEGAGGSTLTPTAQQSQQTPALYFATPVDTPKLGKLGRPGNGAPTPPTAQYNSSQSPFSHTFIDTPKQGSAPSTKSARETSGTQKQTSAKPTAPATQQQNITRPQNSSSGQNYSATARPQLPPTSNKGKATQQTSGQADSKSGNAIINIPDIESVLSSFTGGRLTQKPAQGATPAVSEISGETTGGTTGGASTASPALTAPASGTQRTPAGQAGSLPLVPAAPAAVTSPTNSSTPASAAPAAIAPGSLNQPGANNSSPNRSGVPSPLQPQGAGNQRMNLTQLGGTANNAGTTATGLPNPRDLSGQTPQWQPVGATSDVARSSNGNDTVNITGNGSSANTEQARPAGFGSVPPSRITTEPDILTRVPQVQAVPADDEQTASAPPLYKERELVRPDASPQPHESEGLTMRLPGERTDGANARAASRRPNATEQASGSNTPAETSAFERFATAIPGATPTGELPVPATTTGGTAAGANASGAANGAVTPEEIPLPTILQRGPAGQS